MERSQFAFAQAFDELGEKKRDHAKWSISTPPDRSDR
jgi:hypothetical protein